MTRETKIGLLVGLAFIIVIGILLSDYNRNESQAAALNAVASDVQKGSTTPHNGSNEIASSPPRTPRPGQCRRRMNCALRPNEPPLPTPGTSHAAHAPRPAHAGRQQQSHRHRKRQQFPKWCDRSTQQRQSTAHREPQRAGTADPNRSTSNPPPSNPGRQTVNGAKPYVAVAGDTVSKLAGRFLGGNSKATRDAILEINPTLKQNPNSVSVGKTYMIPAKAGTTASAPPLPPSRNAHSQQ